MTAQVEDARPFPVAEAVTIAIIALVIAVPAGLENSIRLYQRLTGGRNRPPPDVKGHNGGSTCLQQNCNQPTTLVTEESGKQYWQCTNEPPHKFVEQG